MSTLEAMEPVEGTSFVYQAVKRLVDILFAVAGLAILWPVLAGIAIAIKLGSPGPVFYRGKRTGLHGVPFRIYKFRSMVVDAETRGGTTTGQDDPRITRIGRVLRKFKLDELPQLINVLVGDMSIVGPRPEVSEYTDQYTPEEKQILSVRPGITDYSSLEFHDLQQVVGGEDPDRAYRERVLSRKIALRLAYVKQQSLVSDLRILVKTVWVVATKPFRRAR